MDLNKTVFWCVDTQIDFINKDGKLPVPGGETIKPNLKLVTQFAKDNNIKVVSTIDWHNPDSKEISDNPDYVKTFPPHCIANTPGSGFITETNPLVGECMVIDWSTQKGINFPDLHRYRNIVVKKDAFDVFEGNNFTNTLVNNLGTPFLERPTFVVYGVAGDVCVAYAIDGLMRRGYKVVLVNDAVKSLNETVFTNKVTEWSQSDLFTQIKTEELINLKK